MHLKCPALTQLLAWIILSGCSANAEPAFKRQIEARRLAQELLVRFTKASDATNRAVMADTDESSVAFAREAEEQTKLVETDVNALADQLHALDYRDELKLLDDFHAAYESYRALDREILGLAVENTNLKAQQLAFGPAREAAARFRSALDFKPETPCEARMLGMSAALAVSEIAALQSVHIAEANDDKMSALEVDMTRLEAEAKQRLAELTKLRRPELQAGIDTASAALDEFLQVQRRIVAFSRRNSNVRSLALALGPKPALAAGCEQALRALGDHLAQHNLTATR